MRDSFYPHYDWFSQKIRLSVGFLCCVLGNASGAQTTIVIPSETVSVTTSFSYYPSGRVKKNVIEPNATIAATRLEANYEYDATFGNRTKETLTGWNGEAVQDRVKSIGFDANGRFTTTTRNAKDHVEQREYDARFGLTTKLVDANGLMTKWEYDGLGRKRKELRGFASVSSTAFTDYTEWQYERCADISGGCATVDGVSPSYVVTVYVKASNDAKIAPTTKSYRDRLNREIRLESEGSIGGVIKAIFTDTVYDNTGQVAKVSSPYFINEAAQWTTFGYDAIGRKNFELAANGIVTYTNYSALQTSTVIQAMEGSRTRVIKQNGIGLTNEVVDPYGRSAYLMHDANGNLTHSIDAYGTTSVTVYDARGRKISFNDPDLGAWTFVYDSFDELVAQTDAKGQVTRWSYDTLGRLVKRTEADLTTEYAFDTALKGVGKVARASSDNGYCRSHEYDSLGRTSGTRISLGGSDACSAPAESLYTAMTYDSAGRQSTTTFPTNLALKNSYNAQLGFLETVFNNTGGTAGAVYWRWQESDAAGRLTRMSLGNGVSTLKTYDPATAWLRSIYSGTDDNPMLGNVQYAGYTYDSVGNLTDRADRFQLPNLIEKSQHDLMGRLISYARYDGAAGVEISGSRVSVVYDAVGNIKSKSDVGTYYYNAPGGASVRPHAVVEIRGAINASYKYEDPNGNMTSGADRILAYTSFNMVKELGNSGACHRFGYQAEHQRIEQSIHSAACAYATGSNLVSKTLYLHPDGANGLSFERETKAGVVNYKHFINAGGHGCRGADDQYCQYHE